MKKNLLTTGILILVFAALFIACPKDTDEAPPDKVDVPSTGDLPKLPEGSTPVATEADAKALLAGMSGVMNTLNQTIDNVRNDNVSKEKREEGNWSFTDKVSSDSKVKVSGTATRSGDRGNDNSAPKAGDKVKDSSTQKTQASLEQDLTDSTYTLHKGGKREDETRSSTDATMKSDTVVSISVYSWSTAVGFGSTVSGGGKAGKVIVDFKLTQSFKPGDYTMSQDMKPTSTYEGSIKVYGADDKKVVYSLPLTSEANVQEVAWLYNNYN